MSNASPIATGDNVAGGSGLRVIAKEFARNRLALAGLIVLGLLVLVAALAPLLVGGTNDNPAVGLNLLTVLQGPSGAHPLGTDDLGRDELALVLLGTRLSVLLALVTLALTIAIGAAVLAIGAVAAGPRFSSLARVFDVVSTPLLICVLLAGTGIVTQQPLLATFGRVIFDWAQPSAWGSDLFGGAPLLFTLFLVGEVIRFVYLLSRSPRSAQAATSRPTSGTVSVLPGIRGPAAVTGLWIAGGAVLVQSTLSFYGIGAQPPILPLSGMVSEGANYQSMQPLLFLVPLALVFLIVLSLNVVGFGLRSALNESTKPR